MSTLVELSAEEEDLLELFGRMRRRLSRTRLHQAFARCSLALADAIQEELDPAQSDHLPLLSFLAGVRAKEYLRARHSASLDAFMQQRVETLAESLDLRVR